MDDHAQTLAHLRLVVSSAGFWELRALHRAGPGSTMEPRGSFFLIATATKEALVYDRLESAIDWAEEHARDGDELFLGMNPRRHAGKSKDAVTTVTACYADLDLPDGVTPEDALATVTDGNQPVPSFVVMSGYGLHLVYLLREPSDDKATWRKVQRGLVRRWSDLGADRAVATDESRVLRLVPFPNRKRWPDGVPTALVFQSEERYSLDGLATSVVGGTAFSSLELLSAAPDEPEEDIGWVGTSGLLSVERMQDLVHRADGTRMLLEMWIKRTMIPGLHYGMIPINGHEASKPTLLKPGAEIVALLFGWRFHFAADIESLGMYSPGTMGIFAYVCTVLDSKGKTVGQGRGVAELREPGMDNANKTVKMAQKRAQVDAVLRCAGLSQWFTQDLEEAAFVSTLPAAPRNERTFDDRRGRCSVAQVKELRTLLKAARRHEAEVTQHYGARRLEELSTVTANRLIDRLQSLAYGRR